MRGSYQDHVGLEGGGVSPESCRSCRVFCSSCLRLIRLLWNCAFRMFPLSMSAV